VAEVNGDGKPDLVVATSRAQVDVLLGNGDGTFQAALAYDSGGPYLNSLALADVNGDGRLDLVVATDQCPFINCGSAGSVGVLLGNGDSSFRSPVNYNSGGVFPYSVAVADVNGDGKPDLLVTNDGDGIYVNSVGALLGNGDRTFDSALTYSSGGYDPVSLTVADVNGDGRPDLLLGEDFNGAGSVGVLLNNTPFCTTQPVITVSTSPVALWPPNGNMVPVTVSGTITDSGCTVTAATYTVIDDYGKVQPSGLVTRTPGGAYSFTVWLEASRLGTDTEGRVYTVAVSASNNASKTGSEASAVIVPHDQGH
jgi:hypothetical protein